jgi:hypothetical protein
MRPQLLMNCSYEIIRGTFEMDDEICCMGRLFNLGSLPSFDRAGIDQLYGYVRVGSFAL